MCGCESWTINKAEHQWTDAFELWCWRRLLRVPWTPRRSNQSILKEISPEYSLEGLMLKTLATWCEEPTHWKRPWCWEGLKAVGGGVDGGQDIWMALPTQWTWVWSSFGRWWRTGKPGVLQSVGSQRVESCLTATILLKNTDLYPTCKFWLSKSREKIGVWIWS